MLFLRFPLLRFPLLTSWHAPYLPHILMEREKSCNKRALKPLNATTLKNAFHP
ncbi:hypothetical protein I6663_05665 [Helicobacter pylori]|uniref:hypothetical protein n=1 Tax=Helicobacter pylori TaxID=210 RepID=UPI00165A20FC|nr:hypothetical protein [Helicobacter pylori]MBH0259716.1 hypothetical protein [Helicobacter pylori]MBH0262067.1 hypothetical protein [Helicobacter pylori]